MTISAPRLKQGGSCHLLPSALSEAARRTGTVGCMAVPFLKRAGVSLRNHAHQQHTHDEADEGRYGGASRRVRKHPHVRVRVHVYSHSPVLIVFLLQWQERQCVHVRAHYLSRTVHACTRRTFNPDRLTVHLRSWCQCHARKNYSPSASLTARQQRMQIGVTCLRTCLYTCVHTSLYPVWMVYTQGMAIHILLPVPMPMCTHVRT